MRDKILAALIFFTRLPLLRLGGGVPGEAFRHIVVFWPLAGWLTGGAMALAFLGLSQVLPGGPALMLAITLRLLLTSALHEDGLADFLDGLGGGKNREETLRIMKDSHIGSFGTIGLSVYFLLFYQVSVLPALTAARLLFAGDVFSKAVAAQVINVLPYARSQEQSKAHVVYDRMDSGEMLTSLLLGLVPALLILPVPYHAALAAPLMLFWGLCRLLRRKIQGYTGDCCGAIFLILELGFLITCLILHHIS